MTRRICRLFSATLFLLLASALSAIGEVKLIVPPGYLPGVPFLARVEIRDGAGARDLSRWDSEALLSSDQPGVTLSTNRIQMKNGLGTALLTISGSANFNLRAQVGLEEATRAVTNRSGQAVTTVSGLLPGTATTWSGVVSVTGTVTVPAGHTLTINSGTIVRVNGVASGTAGINIVVNGTVRSLGTEGAPVVITCADANLNWGQIRHDSAAASTYQYTFISKATRTAGEGHTGTGPAMRVTNSTIDFDGAVISDMTAGGVTIGKVMMATGSTLTFRDSVLARSRMGPEIASTGLMLTNSWVGEMSGPDDADGIYLHDAGGRPLTLTGSVFAGGNDDAVDTFDSNVLIENCILRDWPNPNEDAKGVSAFHGEVTLRRCLIANCYVGISGKSSGPLAVIRMDHCTIVSITQGVSAATKSNASAGNINIYMTNSIVRSVEALHSDFGPEKFVSVTYCDLSQAWPGTGNITGDPLFVNASGGDFRLQPGSPAIDAGDPAFALDTDGSRTDMGVFAGQSGGGFFVSITEPSAGAIFKAPTNLTVSAVSSTSTGTVVRVEFFENALKIGEDASAPFSVTWPNVPVGSHTIFAVATQTGGLTTTSAPVAFSVTATEGPSTNVFVAPGSVWKYLSDGSDQGTGWTPLSFNDAGWPTNRAEFGYGDGDEATVLGFGPNSNDKYVTYYFRKTFNVDDVSQIETLRLELLRDDGAVVYLNGQEAFRTNMPAGPIGHRTYATGAQEYPWETSVINKALLVNGMNIVAVEVHQGSANSTDMSFDLSLAGIMAAPTNARPIVAISEPQGGSQFGAPANISISSSAEDLDGTVAGVSYYANGNLIGADNNAPFGCAWNNVAAGEYDLVAVATDNFGLSATSAIVRVSVSADVGAPTVILKNPAPGVVANLSEITVVFSKPVVGVNASDLMVNGVAALSMTGSGASYTFSIETPAPGVLNVTWASGHGIADTFVPAHPFEASGAGATWQYQATDSIAPTVEQMTPAARAIVAQLGSISVTFKESVTGVNAADLMVNSTASTSVSGSGAGPYVFNFAQPLAGTVLVNWAAAHGITDLAGNAFAGGNWSYSLDPNQVPVVINEIMYHPSSENPAEEYIELINYGTTPVNVAGWKFSSGVKFTFPNVSIAAGGYLVVAANVAAFNAKYGGVANVVGGWTGKLSNSREDLDLDDASGDRVDSVQYADEGDWAVRQRGGSDRGYRGWGWFAAHDGLGKSVELIDARMSNNNGQNWAASIEEQGTPGRVNSVVANHIAPIVESVSHFPIVPKSTNDVLVTALVTADEGLNATATLNYRVDAVTPGSFIAIAMRDDGAGADAASGDGIFSATIPAQANNAIVEFYIAVSDSGGFSRTWPAPAIAAPDSAGPTGQVVNALYQVDDTDYAGSRPYYKVIMTAQERAELQAIGNNVGGAANSDATMNATFIGFDGAGSQLRYLAGVRNRGHGSRAAKPNNFRINFRSDETWKDQTALNINAQFSWLQVLGSALNLRSGIPGAYSRAVEFRVNNVNLFATGATDRTYGLYAANEPIDADWAEKHFPNDSEGNIYRAVRDLFPPEFDYRTQSAYPTLFGGENKNSYTNTWFKESNASEDDWTDLIAMLRVMGLNGTDSFNDENVSEVIDVSQWLRHLAVMNLLGSSETGLNTGHNDDYFLYRGLNDPRFKLVYYDLDQILGFNGAFAAGSSIFSATNPNGAGQAIGRFMRDPGYEPMYLEHLRNLIDGVFAEGPFNALVDQTLGDWAPDAQRDAIKSWMNTRRNFVRTQLPATPAIVGPLRARISGGPRSPTPRTTASFSVSGDGVTHYRYLLNGALSAEFTVATPISLSNLPNGTNTIVVIGKGAAGTYQSTLGAEKFTWMVNAAMPSVRLNEIIANRGGQLRDAVELYNEGSTTVTLTGMGITDTSANPYRFTFGSRSLSAGAYLVLDADELGFSFDASGESVYLFNTAASGGALLDSVTFGAQLVDLSIGRYGDGAAWRLSQPTLNADNVPQAVGDAKGARINEWLAFGQNPYPDDFVELFNPGSLPINIGDWHLTDEPIGAPVLSRIAPYTFIASKGFVAFRSGNGDQADEINFGLASEQGQIALTDERGRIVDSAVYGPQRAGISSGLCADGSLNVKFLLSPTPGGPNECPFVAPAPQTISLVPYNQVWKYDASGANLNTAWKETNYNDGTWSSGPGPLGNETQTIPVPVVTTIPIGPRTYYFRTAFNYDPAIGPTSLLLTHEIDDGAAFYLNGKDIGRFNLAANADYQTFASTNYGEATIYSMNVPVSELKPGVNWLAAEVHQINAQSGDLVFGLKLDALIVTNTAATAGVVINEVFADNSTLLEGDGTHPDWVELYNPSDKNVTLAGMSLTDTLALRTRWVFPAGAILAAKGYYKIRCDGELPAGDNNTGFGLKANGGALYLFSSEADGSGLVSSINYGLQAADWSIGRVPDGSTNWVLTIPSMGIANNPATLGNPAALRINEWMAEPASGADWFELFNPNAEPVDISRLWLSDSVTTRQKSQLAALSFIGTGAYAFRRFDADDNVSAGGDHVAFKLDGQGEALAVSTRTGALIHGFAFGPQTPNVSEGRLPDGSATLARFVGSPSPGSANFVTLTNVFINEVLSHSDPPLMDAVELFNPTGDAVDISGWFLSDSAVNVRKYQIPNNTVIPANGYIVLYEDAFNGDLASDPFSFSSANGDEVYLSQASGGVLTGYRATASFGAAENGVSFGRFVTSQGAHFVSMQSRTFGRDNPATTNEFKLGTGSANSYPKVGPVVISEVMYHPLGTNDALEFIELRNITSSNAPLYDVQHPANVWRLRKGADFDFATGTVIPANAYIVVVNFNPQTDPVSLGIFQQAYGSGATLFGPFDGGLNNAGDSIELQKPDAPESNGDVPYVLVDRVDYDDAAPWPSAADGTGPSLQRVGESLYGNDPVNWVAQGATPGRGSSGAVDSDGDGLPNEWEQTNGTNPNVPDAFLDLDNDGLSNIAEFQGGTKANDAADPVRIRTATVAPTGITLQFWAGAGRAYNVMVADDNPAGPWRVLRPIAAPASTTLVQVDDAPGAAKVRFYQIMALN